MATRVRLAQRVGLFIEFEPGDRMARFRAAGRHYNVGLQFVSALRRLSGHDSIAVGELCQGARQPMAFIAVLETLASDGVILKEKSTMS